MKYITYDYDAVRNRDFAMPVQVTVEDERELCDSCAGELTSTDLEAGACTQCGAKIETINDEGE